ncbi:hypothetical protein IQ266_25380 [filamentous cyanobacterium LEGE 11480]|uniref:Uncharacterized protein n=1 Tax=Romeriopsis navalis LEGE 11480 TaxID=2777977 RepID=A0A928VVP1_9CYAN|nr:hypothetical protein [Romeriopsis navalis]MBE9033074.1 hypothetical protein [Romeriopsis navalis LEGE 11480]
MQRMRMWGGIFTIAMLLGGGQGFSPAVAKSGTYSAQEYISQQPKEPWLNLQDAQLDLSLAAYAQTGWFGVGNQLREIYIPVVSRTKTGKQKIHLVVTSQDPALLQTVRGMRDAGNQGRPALMKYMKDNQDQILVKRNVSGWVKSREQLDSQTREKLVNLYKNDLAQDFVFVAANAQPNYLVSGGILVGGLALGSWVVSPLLVRDRQSAEA